MLGVKSGLGALTAAEGGEVIEIGGDKGAGGGNTNPASSPSNPRPASKDRLRAAISWRRATFSDWEEPSSERMAEIRESRSEMSASRVDMYSEVMGG